MKPIGLYYFEADPDGNGTIRKRSLHPNGEFICECNGCDFERIATALAITDHIRESSPMLHGQLRDIVTGEWGKGCQSAKVIQAEPSGVAA